VGAILLACALGACSAPPRPAHAPTPPPTLAAPAIAPDSVPRAEPYDVDSEGRFPPPPFVAPRAARGWRDTLDLAVAPPEPQRPALPRRVGDTDAQREQPVYRVQVAACRTLDIANGVQAEIQAGALWPVYIEHEPPYYKVRVGDCAARADCRTLLAQVQAQGWESAWVVRTRIVSP